jgi:superfamily II DNA or RNA helicase
VSRFFTSRQKAALYEAASGQCELCGVPLEKGWHADHVIPYSSGGPTDVVNGQALCAKCNISKGNFMELAHRTKLPEWDITLRDWQKSALDDLREKDSPYLVVATPGAGKTLFALRFAWEQINTGRVSRVVVVTPSKHLKSQWQESAARVGVMLATDVGAAREPADHHGIVTTYQQVFFQAGVQRANCKDKTLVIMDEVHHAGDSSGWGDALETAFSGAYIVLSLSGTPFRTDGQYIPFVNYVDGASVATFSYPYGKALLDQSEHDRCVREVYFPQFEGELEWFSNSRKEVIQAGFGTDLNNETEESERLKTALLSDWAGEVIRQADEKLTELRSGEPGHTQACGVIACMDQAHAQAVARLVRETTGSEPDLIVTDEDGAHKRLSEISSGARACRWIVSVAMVSEGVDIPDLRVAVYATNKVTELFFRQFVGRVVRKIKGHPDDSSAYVYLPADSRIKAMAMEIMHEREHVIKEVEDRQRERLSDASRQASLFDPRGGQAVDAGVIYGMGELSSIEIEEARGFLAKIGASVAPERVALALRDFRKFSAEEVSPTVPTTPIIKQREILREQCNRGHRRACQIHNYPFAKANQWLNQQTGVESIKTATVEQLEERLRLIDEVLVVGKWA